MERLRRKDEQAGIVTGPLERAAEGRNRRGATVCRSAARRAENPPPVEGRRHLRPVDSRAARRGVSTRRAARHRLQGAENRRHQGTPFVSEANEPTPPAPGRQSRLRVVFTLLVVISLGALLAWWLRPVPQPPARRGPRHRDLRRPRRRLRQSRRPRRRRRHRSAPHAASAHVQEPRQRQRNRARGRPAAEGHQRRRGRVRLRGPEVRRQDAARHRRDHAGAPSAEGLVRRLRRRVAGRRNRRDGSPPR